MGWTSFAGNGLKTPDLLRREFEYENDRLSVKILDLAMVGSTAYVLFEHKMKPSSRDVVEDSTYVNDPDGSYRFVGVVLTSRRRGRDGFDFAYKDMEESMGPCERKCPRRIIEAASPLRPLPEGADPDGGGLAWAHRWRADCLANLEKAKGRKKLKDGTRIKLAKPLRFRDGFTGDTFVAETAYYRNRHHRVFRAVGNGGLYRITNLDRVEYVVEG